MVIILTHTVRKHSSTSGEKELVIFLLQPILVSLFGVDPVIRNVSAIKKI